MRSILFLVPGSLWHYQQKGVEHVIQERDEQGFFDKVITVHFPSDRNTTVNMGKRHTIIDFKASRLHAFCKRIGFGMLTQFVHTLHAAWICSRIVRQQQISVVRAVNANEQGFCALLINLLTHVPWCVSLHADYDKRHELTTGRVTFRWRIYKRLERFVLRRAMLVLVIRESLIAYALRNGARKESIRLIPHGMDLRAFTSPCIALFRKKFDPQNSSKQWIVFIGRLSKENYVHDILDIAQKMHDPGVVFYLVGDGPERPALQAKIKERGLHNVILLGYRPNTIVAELRKHAAVNLCLMGGFSLIEAAASARPVISYDVEWHYELIHNAVSGYLVREHDTEAVAQRIHELLQNKALAVRLGKKARQLAIQQHSLDTATKVKVACYKELLGMAQ